MPCKAPIYCATVSSPHVRHFHLRLLPPGPISEILEAGHNLEGFTDAEKTSLLDIGYTSPEDGYNAAKVPKKVYSTVNASFGT